MSRPSTVRAPALAALVLGVGPALSDAARDLAAQTPPAISEAELAAFHPPSVAAPGARRHPPRRQDRGAPPDRARGRPNGTYMHDGSLPTPEDPVEFYDGGGRENPHTDPLPRPLGLTAAERADRVAFLRSLDGRVWGW